MSVMDVTVVNVALPHMMGTFGEDLLTTAWVSTAYSIAEMIMITMSAWWTTLLGRKRYYMASMIIFIAGSMLAGTSHSLSQMVICRIIQGIGGGGLIPCSQAILRETFPQKEQGMAMAIYSMGVMLAPALGPVFGGWLVDKYGWEWIFYINFPICVIGLIMVGAFVEDPPYLKRGVGKIDWTGIALLTLTLGGMQVVMEHGEQVDWFASTWIAVGTVVTVCAAVGLVLWELHTPEPIIDFRLLKNVRLSAGAAVGMVIGFALYGSSFTLPQWTETLLGYPAYQAGLVLLPRALMMFALMPLVGRLYNLINPRFTVGVGIVLLYIAYISLAHFPLLAGFWNFLPPLAIAGSGIALAMVTVSTVSLSSIPRHQMTGASSLYTLSRRVSGNLAYAVLGTVIARRTQFHYARLVEKITPYNATIQNSVASFGTQFMRGGMNPYAAKTSGLAMVKNGVDTHATMMAFNDTYFITAVICIASMLLVLLLPKRSGV